MKTADENWVWVCEPGSSNLHVIKTVISSLLKTHKQELLLIITSEFTEKGNINRREECAETCGLNLNFRFKDLTPFL